MPAPRQFMWLYFFQMPSHYKVSVCVFVTLDAESASSNFSSLFGACLFPGMCITYWNTAKEQKLLFIFSKTTVWAYRGDVGFLWIISCSFFVFFFFTRSLFLNDLHKTENSLGCVKSHTQEADLSLNLLDVLAVVIWIYIAKTTKIFINTTLVWGLTAETFQMKLQGIWKAIISRLTVYKHKVVVLIMKERNISPVLMPHINLRGSMNGQDRTGIGCMTEALTNEGLVQSSNSHCKLSQKFRKILPSAEQVISQFCFYFLPTWISFEQC